MVGGGDQRVCLGDIAQNITKMSIFADFPREPGASFIKVGSNRTNFNLCDCFYNCQFNCIIFVKE